MNRNIIVNNQPSSKYIWEFTVVIPTDKENVYNFMWQGANGFLAEKLAKECHGVILHNVRVQGKKLK